MDEQRGFSVVIAAHNEGAVIEGTLRSVVGNRIDRPLQVVVVANGCTDDTAERVRAFAKALRHEGTEARRHEGEEGAATSGGEECPPLSRRGQTGMSAPPSGAQEPVVEIEVVETAVGNKVHALNLGDRAARYFPRAFLDADVELSPNVLEEVIKCFEGDPGARIVAPGCRHLYTGWNPILAGYYALWRSMPYVRGDMMARGFYAIDRELRGRFAEFPALTADDKFIRNLTRPEERRVVEKAFTRVFMPGTFKDLLRVKTRWTYGNLELAERRPELNENDREGHRGALGHLIKRPWLWVNVPTFLFVYWWTHREAKKRLREKRGAWERAESSRAAEARVAG